MKELKAKPRYKCDFCRRIYMTKTGCHNHELVCVYNPDRSCNCERYQHSLGHPECKYCDIAYQIFMSRGGVDKPYVPTDEDLQIPF